MELLSYIDVEQEHNVADFMNPILASENLPEMQVEEQPTANFPSSTHSEIERVMNKIHEKNKSIFKLIKKTSKRKPRKECVESSVPSQVGQTSGSWLSTSRSRGSETGKNRSVSAQQQQKYSSILNLPKRLHLEEVDASIDNNASQHNFDDFDEDGFSLLNSSGFGCAKLKENPLIDLVNANPRMVLQQQQQKLEQIQKQLLDSNMSQYNISSQSCYFDEWNSFTKQQQLQGEGHGGEQLNNGVNYYDQANAEMRTGLIALLLGREGSSSQQLSEQEQLILLEHLQIVDWQKQVEEVQSAVDPAAIINALYGGGGTVLSNNQENLSQQVAQLYQNQQKNISQHQQQQQNDKQQQQQQQVLLPPGRKSNLVNLVNIGGASSLSNSYSRREKSLEELSKKFLTIFLQKESMMISLDKITQQLDVERRRIYDIINILESLKLVTRRGKNNYKWNGFDQIFTTIETFQSQKDILGCQSSLMENEDENGSMMNQSAGIDLNEKKEKSLEILSIGFLKLFLNYKETLSLEEAARKLSPSDCEFQKIKTKIRRLYDIANVFKSLGLIRKVQLNQTKKPAFQWVGISGLQEFYNSSKEGIGIEEDHEHSLLLGNGEVGSFGEGDENDENDCDSGVGVVVGCDDAPDECVGTDYNDFQEEEEDVEVEDQQEGNEEKYEEEEEEIEGNYDRNKIIFDELNGEKSQSKVYKSKKERKMSNNQVKEFTTHAKDGNENNESMSMKVKSKLNLKPKKKSSQLFSEECVSSSPRIDAADTFISSVSLNQFNAQISNNNNANKILLVSPQLCRKESIDDAESVGGIIMPLQVSNAHLINAPFMNTPITNNRLESARKQSLEDMNEKHLLTPASSHFTMGVLSSSKNSAFKRVDKTPSGNSDFGTPQSALVIGAAPKCTNVVVIPSPSPRNLFSTPKSKAAGNINYSLSDAAENHSSYAFSSADKTAGGKDSTKGFNFSRNPLILANKTGNSMLTTPKGLQSVSGNSTQQRQNQVRSLLFSASASASKSSACKDLSKSFNIRRKGSDFLQKEGNLFQDSSSSSIIKGNVMREVDQSSIGIAAGRIEEIQSTNQIEEEVTAEEAKRIINEQQSRELMSQDDELVKLSRNREGLHGFGEDDDVEDEAVFAKLQQASIKMVKKLDFDGEEEESEVEKEEQALALQGQIAANLRGENGITSNLRSEFHVDSSISKECLTPQAPSGKNIVEKLARKRIQGEIVIGKGRGRPMTKKKSSVASVKRSGMSKYVQQSKESSNAFEHVDLLATMMEVAAHEMRSIALAETLHTNH